MSNTLADYDFKLEHIPGTKIPAPDALSRHPDHIPEEDTDNKDITVLPEERFISAVDLELRTRITSSPKFNPRTAEAFQKIKDSHPKATDSDFRLIPTRNGSLMTYQGHVVIPEDLELQRNVIARYHDHPTRGHPGEQETYRLARKEVYWPGMATFVKNYVKGCQECQQYKINRHPPKAPLQPIPGPKST